MRGLHHAPGQVEPIDKFKGLEISTRQLTIYFVVPRQCQEI